MARIFLSHSSVDELEAVALKNWMADNGWGHDDVFLDIDPKRGLTAGERWQEALYKAADRCEAVVILISPSWAKSKWCLAEFLLAKSLHKLIFGVVLKAVDIGELPTEITSEWQICNLVGDGPNEIIQFSHKQQKQTVEFLAEGLKRLKLGLQKAGLKAEFFPWPPKHDPDRQPYRGFQALDVYDAAMFFGRDMEIQRGLDVLRGMRDSHDKKLFIILGASGSGKSSFLRAGLIPRLKRDDRHFLVLPVIRPQRRPLSGESGFVSVLHKANSDLKLPPLNRGDILAQLKQGPTKLAQYFKVLQDAASDRQVSSTGKAIMPTIIVSVDQAEELFNSDAGQETTDFLNLIGNLLRLDSVNRTLLCILAFTIRSDRYEPLQTAQELTGLQSVVFDDLKPMPLDRFREVILSPAKRASIQGNKLEIKPDLVNQLLEDCKHGGDTLPLLSLTLATLHQDYGSDGDLRLDEYEAMGGINGIVKKEVESILSPELVTRKQQLEWLHAAFIPWLVTINPDNDQPMRRMAKLCDLPPQSHSLINALADKRLLLTDKRDHETVVEISHEALVRQWDELKEWLKIESSDLKNADNLERASKTWKNSGKKKDWLIDGERLANAELLVAKPGFGNRCINCIEFLEESRRISNAKKENEKRRRLEKKKLLQSERDALEQAAVQERNARLAAEREQNQAQAGRLIFQSQIEAELHPNKAFLLAIEAAKRLVSRETDQNLRRAFAMQPRSISRIKNVSSKISAMTLSPNGQLIATAHSDGVINLYEVNGRREVESVKTKYKEPRKIRFSTDAKNLLALFGNNILKVNLESKAITSLPIDSREWPIDFDTSGLQFITVEPAGEQFPEQRIFRVRDIANGNDIASPTYRMADGMMSINSVVASCESIIAIAEVEVSQDRGLITKNPSVTLWNIAEGKRSRVIHVNGQLINLAISPDSNYLLTGFYNSSADGSVYQLCLWATGSIAIVNMPLRKKVISIGIGSSTFKLTFSADSKYFCVVSTDDNIVRVFETKSCAEVSKSEVQAGITDVALAADGKKYAVVSSNSALEVFQIDNGTEISQIDVQHNRSVMDIEWSPNSKQISTVGYIWAQIWDIDSSKAHWMIEGIKDGMSGNRMDSVAFSADGRFLAIGNNGGMIYVWDINARRMIHSFPQSGCITSLAFGSADTNYLATASSDRDFYGHSRVNLPGYNAQGIAKIWNIKEIEPKLITSLTHQSGINQVVFSSDNKYVATASNDNTAKILEINTQKETNIQCDGDVRTIAFSPDGKLIATGCDEKVTVWDTADVSALREIPQPGEVTSLMFSRDGLYIATANKDGNAHVWETETGEEVVRINHQGLRKIAFSPNGKYLATAGADNFVRVWLWRTQSLIEEAYARLKHNMNDAEWRIEETKGDAS